MSITTTPSKRILTGSVAHYDPLENVEPVGEFEHDDPGLRADPEMRALFKDAAKAFQLSPHCGTELHGVQLVRSEVVIGVEFEG